jgi:hypothetical protein
MSAQPPSEAPEASDEATLQQQMESADEEIPRSDLAGQSQAGVGARPAGAPRDGGGQGQSGPSHDSFAAETPPEDDSDTELQELRLWQQKERKRAELRRLKEIRLRYEAGDVSALYMDAGSSAQPSVHLGRPSAPLPRPKDPQVYSKHDRAEFNRWERDCEGFFLRSPASFLLEQQKVDFGVMYLSEPLKTLWRTHVYTEVSLSPLWIQTWIQLKAVMLNALGSPLERQQAAYEKLKSCRQRQGQSPTELLDYMRPLWEELGPGSNALLQVLEYTGALRKEINDDVVREKAHDRATIPQVEELANRSWRRHGFDRSTKDTPAKEKSQRPRVDSRDDAGDAKTLKKPKRARQGRFAPKKPRAADATTDPEVVTCYNCGEAGHKSYKCKKPKKSDSTSTNDKSGKEKGRKD